MSHTTTASSETSYDIPTEARLQVHHNSTDLAHCRSSHLSEDANGELWVLQDVERILVGNGAHRTLQSVVTVALDSGRTIESQQPHCYLRILERLPTGVFADQYELQGLRRRGGKCIHGFCLLFIFVGQSLLMKLLLTTCSFKYYCFVAS
jgi:hypothetical protein